MRLTHPRGRWPSLWPNPGVRPVSTPLLPLLYRCDTMPSSSSSFRTSLLVYHLLSLSPNVWCFSFPSKASDREDLFQFSSFDSDAASCSPSVCSFASYLCRRGRAIHTQTMARRSEEHTSELQSRQYLVCRLLL